LCLDFFIHMRHFNCFVGISSLFHYCCYSIYCSLAAFQISYCCCCCICFFASSQVPQSTASFQAQVPFGTFRQYKNNINFHRHNIAFGLKEKTNQLNYDQQQDGDTKDIFSLNSSDRNDTISTTHGRQLVLAMMEFLH
jgi:hypothetical protein